TLTVLCCLRNQYHLPSFPTRRSSDLPSPAPVAEPAGRDPSTSETREPGPPTKGTPTDDGDHHPRGEATGAGQRAGTPAAGHRRRSEETRLNSSHVKISYAVFCLKKKK